MTLDELRQRWGRVANIGGPSVATDGGSWFGRVTVAKEGEVWPRFEGRPLRPVLQVCVADLPVPVPALDDLAYVTLFADFEVDGTMGDSLYELNRTGAWCLRAYPRGEPLVLCGEPDDLSPWQIACFVLDWTPVDDMACWEEADLDVDDFPEEAHGLNVDKGIKVGGWASLIQGGLYWPPYNAVTKHPAEPKFVMQLHSEFGLGIGDSGTMYVGRGKRGHPEEWAVDWSCY